ncbi:MAG: hypothetical protein EBS19_01580 [Spirochaetia bacterium]|nr:hypothetical protein [Spirochaetia bacterium]
MNLAKLLNEILDGNQNRYGEIEYTLSESDRKIRINEIINSLKDSPILNEKEAQLLSSCIYWGLYDTSSMVEHYIVSFIPFLSVPAVRAGFLRRFELDLTLENRIRFAFQTYNDIKNYGLDHYEWVSMALENLRDWPKEERENLEYKKLIETLLRE